MDSIEIIADEVANYIIEQKILNQKDLSKLIALRIKIAMGNGWSNGDKLRKEIEKNAKLIKDNDKQKIINKFWRDELRKHIDENQMDELYKIINSECNKLNKI